VLQAIVEASKNGAALTEDTNGWMVALFDHEEVGSDSAQGARSPMMFEATKASH
jgi:aspartyl aminopeptidase